MFSFICLFNYNKTYKFNHQVFNIKEKLQHWFSKNMIFQCGPFCVPEYILASTHTRRRWSKRKSTISGTWRRWPKSKTTPSTNATRRIPSIISTAINATRISTNSTRRIHTTTSDISTTAPLSAWEQMFLMY